MNPQFASGLIAFKLNSKVSFQRTKVLDSKSLPYFPLDVSQERLRVAPCESVINMHSQEAVYGRAGPVAMKNEDGVIKFRADKAQFH